MNESFDARVEMNRLRTESIDAQALADEQEAVVRRLLAAVEGGDVRATQDMLNAASTAFADLKSKADQTFGFFDSAQQELASQLAAEDPLFTDRNSDPIALLPVRVETIWWEPSVLRVRVFPDDILMEHFDSELTPQEAQIAAAYWRDPGPDAWQQVLVELRPDRAAWAVRAARPGAPPPVVSSTDPATETIRSVAMPKRWRFVGLNEGSVVVDKLGRPVPDPLPIGLLREEESWETDWFQALVAGMAVELDLPSGTDHLDEVLVVGVREESAVAGATRLRDQLLGHAFAGGLGILAAGTPTNNTPHTRSGWSSAPAFPPPDATDPEDGQRPAAEALVAGLDLPDAGFLRGCSGADDLEASVVAALSLLTWPTLGAGFAEASATHWNLDQRVQGSVESTRPWRAVRDHLVDHVRSRGPLPMLRVGRQPYGVLPVTSLDDWRPSVDLEQLIQPWLAVARDRWRKAVEGEESTVPRVRPDQPVDQIAVDALTRLPVAATLEMRRVYPPSVAIARTSIDEKPTVLGLPGIPPDGSLRWTFQTDGFTDLGNGVDEETGVPRYVARIAPDAVAFPARATATADLFAAVRRFLAGELSAADFDQQWPVPLSSGEERPPRRSTFFDLPALDTPRPEEPPDDDDNPETPPPPRDASGLLDALLFLPNWALQDGDDGEDDPLRQALTVTGDVDQLVADIVEDLVSAHERDERMAEAAAKATELIRFESALRALTAVPVTRLPELLVEVIDVYSMRMDAWVTSLASGRLASMREEGVDGVRLGGYGWVRDLRPPEAREEVELPGLDDVATVSPLDGYIHAPSLQHAATAAVLRSGFLGHSGESTFAVDLTSRRARIARWLLGGVRNGQNLGALLGYRFERALHDADLDGEIPGFRSKFGAPTADEPTPPPGGDDLWSRSTEAIAVSNVVDGMRVARDPGRATSSAIDPTKVGPIVDDVVDALDAVGDLVLAESVHQLVGGSPLRAGVAADTLGRGGDVPDVWRCLRTPHRARALTNRMAVVLPAPPEPGPPAGTAGAQGWTVDPLARALPDLEAWVAGLVGPAAGVTLSGVIGEGDPAPSFDEPLDRLGLGALSTVLDAAGSGQPQLSEAVRSARQVVPGTPVSFAGPAWRRLQGMAERLRALLVTAQPLLPRHLPGEPTDVSLDVTGAQVRLTTFAQTAVAAGRPGADALVAAATASPDDPDRGGREGWLSAARAALAEVVGTDVPVLPTLVGAAGVSAAPIGRTDVAAADVIDWLRREGEVRSGARALHETLTLSVLVSGVQQPMLVAQHPIGPSPDDSWVGGTFPVNHRPPATTHLLWHQPQEVQPGAMVTGLVLDEWVELLPGADRLPDVVEGASVDAELTGIAFHYDRPDAKPPHAVLLAVPPDAGRGWTANGLLQVLRETYELATLRAVDDEDLPLLRALLPAMRVDPDSGTGQALSRFETLRPDLKDVAAPYRLQARYRDEMQLDAGLSARTHDPLWLLTRQWQFGEFTAQDAGSPAVVSITGGSAPIDAWRPVGAPDWVPWDATAGPLDTLVEDEPVRSDERLRAYGGAHLLRLLGDADLVAAASGALTAHAMAAGDPDGSIVDLAGGQVPDADAVAAALDAGTFDPAQQPALAAVTSRWRAWWREQLAERGPDCFDPHRFEHAVEVSVGGTVLRADEYLGDGLDWYGFDVRSEEDGDPASAPAPPGDRRTFAVEGLPSTVSFGGLPADRFWEMEDARIDLGAAAMSTLDTGRLLLVSFATVYGNDWFLVPVEVPVGSLTTLDRLLVRDVFGRNHLLERAGREDPSWSMFSLTSPDPDLLAASGLLVLPVEGGQAGEPLERVGLTRDELANLAWAVQHRYTDGRGVAVERRDEWLKIAPPPTPPGDLPRYGVQTVVPDYWFPLVPEPIRPDAVRFRLVELSGAEPAPELPGRLIERGLWVHEEEVPRDGAWVQRRPVLARWFDGSWHAWVRREKNPGTGESSSGLAFDTVRPTQPWPQ